MSIDLIGTRIGKAGQSPAALIDQLDVSCGTGVAIVSSYWDARAFETARDLALRAGGIASMVLWIGGATTGSAWEAVSNSLDDRMLDIAFIGSPKDGIFHPKVVGVTGPEGSWQTAVIGSANFTRAGHETNVELGVLVRHEADVLEPLASWFEELWGEATSAYDVLADHPDLAERTDRLGRRFDADARKHSFDDVLDPMHVVEPERLRRAKSEQRRNAPPNLGACHRHDAQVLRYLDVIVDRLATERPRRRLPGQRIIEGASIERLHLTYTEGQIELRMYPGDVLGQARVLYDVPSRVASVLALQSDGWQVRPNFHWGFRQSGMVHVGDMPGTLDVDAYTQYWMDHIRSTRQINADEYSTYLDRLTEDNIIDVGHRKLFDATFPGIRNNAAPRPGLAAVFRWPLADAERLDGEQKFVDQIRDRANDMLAALDDPLLT